MGLVFILCVVLIPTYKTEAITTSDNSPFTFGASLDKTSVYVGDVNIKATTTVQWDNSWNMNYLYTTPEARSARFPHTRYFMVSEANFTLGSSEAYRSYVASSGSTTLSDMIETEKIKEGHIPFQSLNKSEMTVTVYNDTFKVGVNGDYGTGTQKLDYASPTYSNVSFIAGISKLPAGNYRAVFQANPYIYVLEESCTDKWWTGIFGSLSTTESDKNVCGWTSLGTVTKTFYKRTWPMGITIPFTISTPPTPDPIPSGSISTAGCSIPLDASTCTASLNWTTANLTSASGTGNAIRVFHSLGDVTNVGEYVGTGETSANVSVTPPLNYNKSNTFWLVNDIFATGGAGAYTHMVFDTVNFTALCAKGLVWNDLAGQCKTTNATVDVTVNPYVDVAQKSASIIKGDSVTLRWTSNNATACSCSDSDGKDCFAKGSYSNPTTGYTYAGYTGVTTAGETPPITPDKTTKFYITCK